MIVMIASIPVAFSGSDALAQETPTAGQPTFTVGQIEIITRNIFADSETQAANGVLSTVQRTMNSLHFNTRHYVLRNELLFAEGEAFDPVLLEETERNLRELGYLNNIKVTATDTTETGQVNITVDVRESWTLQANLSFALNSGGDSRWSAQLSDKNFLGHGFTLGAGIGADENAAYWNTWFRKRRLTPLHLLVGFDYSHREDGHFRDIFISKPFYAHHDAWGSEAIAWDGLSDVRFYLSNAGPAGIDPTSGASLYAKLPTRNQGLHLHFQARLSSRSSERVWRLGAGLRITDVVALMDQQPAWVLSDGRVADLGFLTEPGQPLAREQGVTVFPHLYLRSQSRSWTKARFVLQYGPVEDIPLTWVLDLRTGPNGPTMGSTTGFGGESWLTEATVSRWLKVGPALAHLNGTLVWQTGDKENQHYLYTLNTGWITRRGPENHPWISRVFAEYAQGENLLGSQALLLGLSRGLRTLEFDGMAGDRLVRWNLEQGKATSWEVMDMFRLGGAVFYNGGLAWWQDEDRTMADARHELGFGLRLGPTRSASAQVSRLDVSWALDGSVGPVFTATTRGFF